MFLGLTGVDLIGILGSFLIAGAYLAVSRGWVDGRHPPFNLMNLAGAILILVSLFASPDPSIGAILIEVFWIAIALAALLHYVVRR